MRDPKFQENEFFDPRDLVQVKYEMLRRVSVEKTSVTEATEEYGVSRPTYYQTKASFDKGGLAGLVPRKRGPHGPHKLQGEALAFVQQQLVAGQPVRARELAKLVRQKFDLAIHPRTIERVGRWKKNTAMTNAKNNAVDPSIAVTQYETLRAAALGNALPPEARAGLMLFLHTGMWGWARAVTAMRTFERPTGSRPSNWKPPEEHRTVIHLFAAMAIPTTISGATP